MRAGAWAVVRALTSVTAAGALALAAVPSDHVSASSASPRSRPRTSIVIKVRSNRGRAPTHLLGTNAHYEANGYRLWDVTRDAPVPAVVSGSRRAGIDSARFPGGTQANLYDWKRAIGPHHGCQVVGPHGHEPARVMTRGLGFGPDEYMRFMDLIHARPLIMVPFVTDTPESAADWVEYMNAPAGTDANPHGGTNWADVRAANGHPRPYGVHWWEIGNEQQHAHSRYWMSPRTQQALHQYVSGGSRLITGERLGKGCDHPRAGVPSDGAASQTFAVLWPPVAPASVRVVIGGRVWTRVSDLTGAGPGARVFTVDGPSGQVRFGDGVHGAVPPSGSTVQASYRTVHQGYFDFVRRMKQVDPSIKVCSSWATPAFNRVVAGRRYDCLGEHAIAVFTSPHGGRPRWSGPLEGHDRFILASESVQGRVQRMLSTTPRATPTLLTEFTTMHGDSRAYPGWAASESHAVFMASLWASWLTMRIPWGDGDNLLWTVDRGVLGPSPHYTFTADAVTRQALAAMFSAGGRLLAARIANNPVRRPPSARGSHPSSYPALTVAATRKRQALRLLVVNRLPLHGLRAHIVLRGRSARGRARLRSVVAQSYRAWNRPGRPPSVVLRRRSVAVHATGFTHWFPPASTTVVRIPLR